jgi:hypothetical protein
MAQKNFVSPPFPRPTKTFPLGMPLLANWNDLHFKNCYIAPCAYLPPPGSSGLKHPKARYRLLLCVRPCQLGRWPVRGNTCTTAVSFLKPQPGSRGGLKYPPGLLESSKYNSCSRWRRRAAIGAFCGIPQGPDLNQFCCSLKGLISSGASHPLQMAHLTRSRI